MQVFFNKIFKRGTVENRLLLVLLLVTVLIVLIDNLFDQLTRYEIQNWLALFSLKFLFVTPFILFLIYFLTRILNYKLSKAEKALLTSEERFRIIFERNTSAILIVEKDTTISMVNGAFCAATGYSCKEIVGTKWTKLIHEDDLERLTEFNRLRLKEQSDIPDVYEFRFYKKSGEIRVCLISVFYDKLLNQTVASFTDVTERKEIENSLRESREEYRKLVELQGEGLAIVDKEERFIFTNPAAERMMGVPAGTLIGRKMDEFVSKTTFEQIKQQTIIRADGNQSTYEIEIIRENGEKRVILVTATPQFDSNGVFESSLGIFIDITDRKNIENELKKNESTLKALNTTKDKLFSIIAHDLRGPIGTSADLLEVMIENYENFSSDEQLKMLDILKNSAKSTYSLLETLLNWSIVQTGNIVFRPELFNLTKCVDTIVRNVVPTLYSKNITLLYEPAEEIFCYADQNMIQTVIRNLIGNAIKYTFRNGTIEIRVINKGNNTEISISDNGIGMDEETRNNLFVLDKQSSKYGTENEKGTGLGLILCKEFIEKHGGHLLIESEKDKGSSFTFELPQINSKGEAPGLKGNEENRTQKKFNNELILIVEDDEINYQILKSMLTSVNVKCERASTGKEAVSMFLKNNYSLILLDIQLPEMNGWEATMKIRENDTEIPIIAVTAYASDPTRRRSIEAGCNDFITKPIHKAKLLQMLDKYLRKNTISSNIEK